MRDQGTITQAQYRFARRSKIGLEPGTPLRGDPRAVLLRVRPRRARARVRRRARPLGRAERLHDDPAPLAEARAGRDPRHADRAGRPRGGPHLDRPGDRRDPRDERHRPGPREQPVQPPLAGTAAAGLHVQDVRSRRRRGAGHGSRLDVLRLGALHLPSRRRRQLRRRQLVVRQDVRLELRRLDVGRARDAALGQQRVRAADARRRVASGRVPRPAARRADAAPGARAVPARDGARLGGRVAARHGVRLRDARRRRDLHEADRDPAR